MNGPAFSEELRSRLSIGKYSSWAVDLTDENVEALLWMVGEYGMRAMAMRRANGSEPLPLYQHDAIVNARMQAALQTIADIQSGERPNAEDVKRIISRAVTEAGK